MKREVIHTDAAPAAVGPYSQAIRLGSMVYSSGQIPLDPETGEIVAGGIKEQAERALTNLRSVIEASGSSLDQVIKVTCFITDMKMFADMNAVYAGFFGKNPPARSCVGVASLPKGSLVEFEAIATVE
ncbi:MAG: RidA family protein [Spirochaetaceae bacterium]|nr:MAG: RidA family protein [Spirochaetaceae bacterium]